MPKKFANTQDWLRYDQKHLWHPYTSIRDPLPTYPVVSTSGVYVHLADGRKLIDGMSSWWCAIHGYGHPRLVEAASQQVEQMSHVMFGGIAHEPASLLASHLVDITADPLQYVFLADSGSISVEVALKMALQYWVSQGETKRKLFLSPRGGYHGDPFACMSVSDPDNGMHSLYAGFLPKQLFADVPQIKFDQPWETTDLDSMREIIARQGNEIAAVILEPIVQNAGGMNFYHPSYLKELRSLCDESGILLIFDEIATGFGRTGKLFANEHAGVAPDIMCVGKALTGGMMTLAATLTNDRVADGISSGVAPQLMHGPTFMGNPLACAVANASIKLLLEQSWEQNVSRIEAGLVVGLDGLRSCDAVADVRVLGAIGVVEMKNVVDVAVWQKHFVDLGVWIRPFGRLVYIMPPYVITDEELSTLTRAIGTVVGRIDECKI